MGCCLYPLVQLVTSPAYMAISPSSNEAAGGCPGRQNIEQLAGCYGTAAKTSRRHAAGIGSTRCHIDAIAQEGGCKVRENPVRSRMAMDRSISASCAGIIV